MKLHLVTVVTHADEYLPALEDSCKQFGHTLIKLGWGQKWSSFCMKLTLTRDYILKHCEPDDVLCFIDAYDVLVLSTPEEFLEAYRPIEPKCLVSAEDRALFGSRPLYNFLYDLVYCDLGLSRAWPRGTRLNSGAWMSRCDTLYKILRRLSPTETNDQRFFAEQFIDHKDQIELEDDSKQLFHTMFEPEKLDFVEGRVVLRATNKPVLLVHGPGRQNLDFIVEFYKWAPKLQKNKKSKSLWNYVLYQFKTYWQCNRFQLFVLTVLGVIYVLCSTFA
jgi:hypothetical protein